MYDECECDKCANECAYACRNCSTSECSNSVDASDGFVVAAACEKTDSLCVNSAAYRSTINKTVNLLCLVLHNRRTALINRAAPSGYLKRSKASKGLQRLKRSKVQQRSPKTDPGGGYRIIE